MMSKKFFAVLETTLVSRTIGPYRTREDAEEMAGTDYEVIEMEASAEEYESLPKLAWRPAGYYNPQPQE